MLLAPVSTAAIAAVSAAVGQAAPEPVPELRSALVARGGGEAFVVVRLTGDLPRDEDGAVRAALRISGRAAGTVRALDRISFRHYCFRAQLRRPWPAVGRRVQITVRAPNLPRPLRTTRIVTRKGAHDEIGGRLGCRLPTGAARKSGARNRDSSLATAGRS